MAHCKACGATLAGRIDKQFCDDACRSGFHNQKNREQDSYILKTNKILKKNRKVLAHYHDNDRHPVLIRKLLEEGFLFDYCTKIEPVNGKREYVCFCYEYGYKTVNKTQVEIVHKLI